MKKMELKAKKSCKKSKSITIILLSLYCAATCIPLYFVLVNAFKSNNNIIKNPFVVSFHTFTLDGMKNAWRILDYPHTFMNNVILLILSSLMLVTFGSMAGFAISTAKSKLLNGYYLVLIGVMTLPFTLGMVPLAVLMKFLHLSNSYLGTSLVYAACTLPFAIFLYTGYMRSLPKELAEASIVDGCTMFKTYFYIYMPLLKAITGTVIILRGVFFWNDYLISFITLTKPNMAPLALKLYSFASLRLTSWDLLFAGTLLCSLPITLLFIFFQRVFVGGITAGAVKG